MKWSGCYGTEWLLLQRHRSPLSFTLIKGKFSPSIVIYPFYHIHHVHHCPFLDCHPPNVAAIDQVSCRVEWETLLAERPDTTGAPVSPVSVFFF